jgi:hypothetical protein
VRLYFYAASFPHFFDVAQRREQLAGDLLGCELFTINQRAEAAHRHSAHRKSDFDGLRKPQWRVGVDQTEVDGAAF